MLIKWQKCDLQFTNRIDKTINDKIGNREVLKQHWSIELQNCYLKHFLCWCKQLLGKWTNKYKNFDFTFVLYMEEGEADGLLKKR